MNFKNLLLSAVLFLFCITFYANTNKIKATFTSNAIITDVETSLSFFIPEEHQSVFVYVSDVNEKVFQKVKVYQRGNGTIICDKNGLPAGTYYYTLSVDGEDVDTQKLTIK